MKHRSVRFASRFIALLLCALLVPGTGLAAMDWAAFVAAVDTAVSAKQGGTDTSVVIDANVLGDAEIKMADSVLSSGYTDGNGQLIGGSSRG